jgi:hypothetical protein
LGLSLRIDRIPFLQTILSRLPLSHVAAFASSLEPTLPGIRIIIAGLSPLLGDMVTQILAGRWHIESVTRLETRGDLTKCMAGMVVDLMVVGRDGGGSETVPFGLLTTYPDVSVLELSADGRTAWLHRAPALPLAFVDFSPQELIDALASGGSQKLVSARRKSNRA